MLAKILGVSFIFPILTVGMDSISARSDVPEGPRQLTESAIGLWLQQHQLATRVCHREITKEYNGVGEKFPVGSCKISLIETGGELNTGYEACPGDDVCTATLTLELTIRTSDGVRDVTSAVNCTCIPRDLACRRMPSKRLFFKGTKYEKTLDVGQCIGQCREQGSHGIQCKPVLSKTVSITGPNGAKCVSVIQSCACEKRCYRASHMEAIHVLHDNNTVTKVIDVGKCIGTCTGHVKGNCLYWINKITETGTTSRHCAIRTTSRRRSCFPESTTSRHFGGKSVTVITTCACH